MDNYRMSGEISDIWALDEHRIYRQIPDICPLISGRPYIRNTLVFISERIPDITKSGYPAVIVIVSNLKRFDKKKRFLQGFALAYNSLDKNCL